MFLVFDRVEEACHFLPAQHHGQLLLLAAGWDDVVEIPIPLESDLVEEADGGHRDADRTGRELPVPGQVNLVGSDVLRPKQLGRLVEMAGE